MRYTQLVRGPYDIAMMPDGLSIKDVATGAEAINLFVRYCLPPIPGRTACVTDVDGVVAIGYVSSELADEPLRWVGTKSAVGELRSHPLVEPLLMTSIEMALES
jgi:hypothetical protein